jgi:hypothetical protein
VWIFSRVIDYEFLCMVYMMTSYKQKQKVSEIFPMNPFSSLEND